MLALGVSSNAHEEEIYGMKPVLYLMKYSALWGEPEQLDLGNVFTTVML